MSLYTALAESNNSLWAALAHNEDVFGVLSKRYPRLLRSMRSVACLSRTEALAGLRDYVYARDGIYGPNHSDDMLRYGGGEAVCHFGGPQRVLQSATACPTRRYARKFMRW